MLFNLFGSNKNRNLLMDMPRNWLMRLSKVKSMQISWKN